MPTIRYGAAFALALVIQATAGTPTLYAEEAKQIIVHNPLAIPPESLQSMWARSDAVARVRILSSEAKAIGTDPVHVYTEARAQVLDVFKGNARPGTTITFLQNAGEVETRTQIIRVEGVTPLPIKREYVVFLTHSQPLEAMLLSYDVDGAFEIRDGRVLPQGHSVVAQEQRNLAERKFVAQLARLRDRDGVIK
jgi:hypothetical protein